MKGELLTIAEIHGKISGLGSNLTDRMEDLLTSDVFTACKYLKPQTLLVPFLNQSFGLKNTKFTNLLNVPVVSAEYHFWPRLNRSEPDVLISLMLESGKYIVVIIEAKYFSSLSGDSPTEENLTIATAPKGQLAREYLDLLESASFLCIPSKKVSSYVLIYLTAHRMIPEDSMRDSYQEIRHFNVPTINLFWTNWFALIPIIKSLSSQDQESLIIEDLHLLLKRKRFVHYAGYILDSLEKLPTQSIFKSDSIHVSSYYLSVQELDDIGTIYNGGV